MRITLLDVENYKRIKKIVIAPGSRNFILIAGMNKQGKSSLLGAITTTLGGKGEEPEMPIREGEDHADIRIDLEGDDGSYQVHKRFLKSGNSSLKVTGKDGKLSSPQKVLDRIIGTRFLDPLMFSRLDDKLQFEALLGCVDLEIDLKEWAVEHKATYELRTTANRDAKRAKVQLEENPDPGSIPEVSTADLVNAISKLNDKAAAHASAKGTYAQLKKEATEKKEYIERLKKQVERATDEYEKICDDGKEAKENLAKAPDVYDELAAKRRELEEASGQEEVRIRKMAQLERHKVSKLTYENCVEESRQCTEKLEALDKKKKIALEKAEMPVKGLSIGDDSLTYNNIPLSQASGAEQLTVSLALAAAMSPHLDDIWVEDGALLDENSLKLVEEFATKKNKRVWLERVGESDENAVIIEDGSVRV
jgi:chromosome segregation ATPase